MTERLVAPPGVEHFDRGRRYPPPHRSSRQIPELLGPAPHRPIRHP
jgi:hypothetical protein